MKEIYKSVNTILLADTDLKALVEYTLAKANIRRGYDFSGGWDKLVAYYMQPDAVIADFSPNIREVPLIIRVLDRTDDLNCFDVAERVVILLDGADLSQEGLYVYDCAYTGAMSGVQYNSEVKSYEKILRFMIKARVN